MGVLWSSVCTLKWAYSECVSLSSQIMGIFIDLVTRAKVVCVKFRGKAQLPSQQQQSAHYRNGLWVTVPNSN